MSAAAPAPPTGDPGSDSSLAHADGAARADGYGELSHADHGHGDHGDHAHVHDPNSPHGHAHHFESWRQQFDAGKLGMWLFLAQEVLFFSALFCLYSVYRSLHPEVWEYADRFLSVPHGAFNTAVLLFSSLTMALGVRCAMLGQRIGLTGCIAATLFCAALFLGVKSFEYTEKAHLHILWAGATEEPVMGGTRYWVEPGRRRDGADRRGRDAGSAGSGRVGGGVGEDGGDARQAERRLCDRGVGECWWGRGCAGS